MSSNTATEQKLLALDKALELVDQYITVIANDPGDPVLPANLLPASKQDIRSALIVAANTMLHTIQLHAGAPEAKAAEELYMRAFRGWLQLAFFAEPNSPDAPFAEELASTHCRIEFAGNAFAQERIRAYQRKPFEGPAQVDALTSRRSHVDPPEVCIRYISERNTEWKRHLGDQARLADALASFVPDEYREAVRSSLMSHESTATTKPASTGCLIWIMASAIVPSIWQMVP